MVLHESIIFLGQPDLKWLSCVIIVFFFFVLKTEILYGIVINL